MLNLPAGRQGLFQHPSKIKEDSETSSEWQYRSKIFAQTKNHIEIKRIRI